MPARRGTRAKTSASRPASGARSKAKRTTTRARSASARKAKPVRKAKPAAKKRVVAKKRAVATKRAATKKRAVAKKRAVPKHPAAPRARLAATRSTGRDAVLAALHAGRDAIFAACRELTRETWEAPIAAGKWNPRQIVAHLAFWDAWTISEIPVRLLEPHRRLGAGEDVDRTNAKAVAAADMLDADTTLGEFLDGRAQLVSAVGAVPAAPAAMWTDAHSLGRLFADFPEHDLHHAAQIRTAAARRAFAPQRAAASAKELLLFELQRARVALLAALKGLPPGAAERPLGPGKWTVRELVLHLAVRDRVRLEEFDDVLSGTPVSWAGASDAAMAQINERHLAELRHLSWDDALRLLSRTRDELVHRLLGVPASPAEVWGEGHPFGAMLRMLPPHDRKHAQQIQDARIAG